MKKLIYSIVLLLLFSACQPLTKEKEQSEAELHTENQINKIEIHDLEILEIDNCQYIFYKKSPSTNKGFGFMAHKGNCKNPIHCHNKNNIEPEE